MSGAGSQKKVASTNASLNMLDKVNLRESAYPRSHGGCITCKIRKIKCDETRPACHRCSSTGRTCDGYQMIQSLRLSILTNPKELRSYHYFWKQVLPLLPGHYDHLFWGVWIRQACFKELAIQHAMVAIGAAHESIVSGVEGNSWAAARLKFFSIQQYNEAIKCLTTEAGSSPSKECILTTCILFITFENLYGRNSEALKHLKSGIAVLQSWKPGTVSEMALKEEYLTPIYTRGYVYAAPANLPTAFEDLQAARKYLHMVLDMIYSSINSSVVLGDKLVADTQVLHARGMLQEWFVMFTRQRAPKDIERRRAAILLRLQYETSLILLAAVGLEDECEFDDYNDSFQVIVDQCERLVALEAVLIGNESSKPKAFTYGFDIGFLPALNVTAFKCRDPQIRRKAITLLEAGNRYEGLWNGKTVARIAREAMKLEEADLASVVNCTDIPGSARVRLLTLSYEPGRPAFACRDGEHSFRKTPHYSIEWTRDYPTGQSENIRGYLPVSADEKSCSWGPGNSPWYMTFQYDPEWAQWKTSLRQRGNLSIDADKGERSSRSKPDVNLFWDHWRLRKLAVQERREVADDILEKATSSGRSYGDAQTPDGVSQHPSHVLISLA